MKPPAATRNIGAVALTGLCALALALGGCATVKPFEREMLADPIMDANLGFGKVILRV